MDGSLDRHKAAARAEAKARLSGFADPRDAVSAAIVGHFTASEFWRPGARVMAFLAMRDEVDLETLWRSPGPTIGVPRACTQDGSMTVHAIVDPATDALPGAFGVREPSATAPVIDPGELDVVLVPGLAFDRDGRRLGRGGGFYDRFLSGLATRSTGVTFIGVCWSELVVSAVPVGPLDRSVHMLLTEHGLTRCAGLS